MAMGKTVPCGHKENQGKQSCDQDTPRHRSPVGQVKVAGFCSHSSRSLPVLTSWVKARRVHEPEFGTIRDVGNRVPAHSKHRKNSVLVHMAIPSCVAPPGHRLV